MITNEMRSKVTIMDYVLMIISTIGLLGYT